MSQKRTNQIVSICEAIEAMHVLAQGENLPSMLQALRNSSLSKRTFLINNCGYALAIRKYRDQRLPERAILEQELRSAIRQDGSGLPAWGLMEGHIDTLYAIDDAWFNGKIPMDYGSTLESQRVWRDKVISEIKGMGSKLVSWALFIYDP